MESPVPPGWGSFFLSELRLANFGEDPAEEANTNGT
jgi:hypothetical protein